MVHLSTSKEEMVSSDIDQTTEEMQAQINHRYRELINGARQAMTVILEDVGEMGIKADKFLDRGVHSWIDFEHETVGYMEDMD